MSPSSKTLIDSSSHLEQVATGFGFTEGPAWNDKGGYLVFSDIPGNAMWRWEPESGVAEYRKPSNMGNGSTYDPKGRLITCEHATSRVVREEGDNLVVLADHFEGGELNSPNDAVVGPSGDTYFTDPTYGRQEYFGVPRELGQPFRGVYRVLTTGELQLLAKDFDEPNGLCFSIDGRTLFVNDTERMHIRAFNVGQDGTLSGGEVWAEVTGEGPGGPDGMKIDVEGNIYCTGPGGFHIFDPDGKHLEAVPTPEVVGNLAWGESDRKTLFVCASTSVYRITTLVPGYRPY
ncbi:MAG: SMP-30/gluconolactonase/LRE family protein [Thermoguttaceae bacterium]|jgi:gluconolactonase